MVRSPFDRGLRRRLQFFYLLTSSAFLLLTLVLVAGALAQAPTTTSTAGTTTSSIAGPATTAQQQAPAVDRGPFNGKVPTGSDDATVEAYYNYLDLREFGELSETYTIKWSFLGWTFAAAGVSLIVLYFFVFAWYARRSTSDLYPVEVYNGYITERGGPVDPFNWATYAILIGLVIAYAVWNLIYGQMY